MMSVNALISMNFVCGMTVFLKIGNIDNTKPRSPIIGYDFENESHVCAITTAKKESPICGSLSLSKNLTVMGTTKMTWYKLNMPLYNGVKKSNISVNIYHQRPMLGENLSKNRMLP